MIEWIMSGFALLGTFLITSTKRKVRLVAFCVWFFTNAYWAIFAENTSLQVLFGIYFILAIVGIYNNRKGADND